MWIPTCAEGLSLCTHLCRHIQCCIAWLCFCHCTPSLTWMESAIIQPRGKSEFPEKITTNRTLACRTEVSHIQSCTSYPWPPAAFPSFAVYSETCWHSGSCLELRPTQWPSRQICQGFPTSNVLPVAVSFSCARLQIPWAERPRATWARIVCHKRRVLTRGKSLGSACRCSGKEQLEEL